MGNNMNCQKAPSTSPAKDLEILRRIAARNTSANTARAKRQSKSRLEQDFKKTSMKIRVETRKSTPIPEEKLLLQNFRDPLYNDEETDIVLRLQGQDFRSHRAILAARSAVFAAMLKHDMKEKLSGVLVLEDCDPGVFECFLKHLHKGSIEFSEDTVIRLYQLADKYDSPDLKKECVDFMSRTISVDSFCEMAKLSLDCNESELLEAAVNFFMKNIEQVSLSAEWQTFQKEHPLQANEFNLKALDYHGKHV